MIETLLSVLFVAIVFAAFGLFRAKAGEESACHGCAGACETCELERWEIDHET